MNKERMGYYILELSISFNLFSLMLNMMYLKGWSSLIFIIFHLILLILILPLWISSIKRNNFTVFYNKYLPKILQDRTGCEKQKEASDVNN